MEQELVSRVAQLLAVEPALIEHALQEKGQYQRRTRKKPGKDAEGRPRVRVLHIPPPVVKKVQRAIHRHLLNLGNSWFRKLGSDFAWPVAMHGFLPRRSNLTAARDHIGNTALFTLDFADAFPSVKRERVATALRWHAKLGRREANFIARLATYRGRLRQGSPSSPLLFNLVVLNLLKSLERLATERGYRVTIYCDEVAITADKPIPAEERRAILQLVIQAGFAVHPKKIRYQEARWGALEVTKVLVRPDRLGLSTRHTIDRVRAFIDHLARRGTADAKELAKARGYIGWVELVDPEKLKTRLRKSLVQLAKLEQGGGHS